jgi:hypothetical protein
MKQNLTQIFPILKFGTYILIKLTWQKYYLKNTHLINFTLSLSLSGFSQASVAVESSTKTLCPRLNQLYHASPLKSAFPVSPSNSFLQFN